MSENTARTDASGDQCAPRSAEINGNDVAPQPDAVPPASEADSPAQRSKESTERANGTNSEQTIDAREAEKAASQEAGDATTAEILKASESLADSSSSSSKSDAQDPAEPKVVSSKPDDSTTAAISGEESNSRNSICDQDESNASETNASEPPTMSRLEEEIQTRTGERDSYRAKLEEAERKLSVLQTLYEKALRGGGNDSAAHRAEMQQLKSRLAQTALQLQDRSRVVANQENQINALNHQVTTLKEVVACTRQLLQIRNTEVKHLQTEVDDMESRITEERDRHNTMINKMDVAVRLNADLKKEYETQLRLFKELREKYDEKVTLLSEEKEALESAAQIK